MDTGEVLLVAFGVLAGGALLVALAYLVVRPLVQSTQAWLQESQGSRERGTEIDSSRRRRSPRPPIEGWSAESSAHYPPRDGRLPIPPGGEGIDATGYVHPPPHLNSLDRIKEEVVRFEQRLGTRPALYALDEGGSSQYCLHVNMPIRNASEDANAYFVCSDGFPGVPPTTIVSVAGGLDQYGQAREQEIELELRTIRNWRSDQTLLQIYEEILDQLDDGHFEVSETRSTFFASFDKYGQIVS